MILPSGLPDFQCSLSSHHQTGCPGGINLHQAIGRIVPQDIHSGLALIISLNYMKGGSIVTSPASGETETANDVFIVGNEPLYRIWWYDHICVYHQEAICIGMKQPLLKQPVAGIINFRPRVNGYHFLNPVALPSEKPYNSGHEEGAHLVWVNVAESDG